MNLEIHHNGQNDYFDTIKRRFKNKIQTVKKSKVLTSKSKKVKLKAIKRAFLKEKKETEYNNF